MKVIDRTELPDSFSHENNDCTVHAFGRVTGKPYAEIHALVKAAGRKDGRGHYTYAHLGSKPEGKEFAGCKFQHVDRGLWTHRQTAGTFAAQHPVGRFMITKRGHAFALVDGVIYDSARFSPRSIVRDAWAVTDLAPINPEHQKSIDAWNRFSE